VKRKRSFAPRYPARLTLPILAYDAIFFLGPLAILIVFSFAETVGFGQVSYALSGGNFRQLWDSLYLDIFKTTLEMAAIGTVLTLLVGYPMAYWMARCLTNGKSLALILVIIPFLTSFLI
jgi:spermidine/putrescine transport system permease protein